jgi:UDP-N-acetylmuramate-alanine ligase
MAGLAGLAIQKGYKVTGQDKAYYSPMSDQLISLGIKENKT